MWRRTEAAGATRRCTTHRRPFLASITPTWTARDPRRQSSAGRRTAHWMCSGTRNHKSRRGAIKSREVLPSAGSIRSSKVASGARACGTRTCCDLPRRSRSAARSCRAQPAPRKAAWRPAARACATHEAAASGRPPPAAALFTKIGFGPLRRRALADVSVQGALPHTSARAAPRAGPNLIFIERDGHRRRRNHAAGV